jgi:hypothetical protein
MEILDRSALAGESAEAGWEAGTSVFATPEDLAEGFTDEAEYLTEGASSFAAFEEELGEAEDLVAGCGCGRHENLAPDVAGEALGEGLADEGFDQSLDEAYGETYGEMYGQDFDEAHGQTFGESSGEALDEGYESWAEGPTAPGPAPARVAAGGLVVPQVPMLRHHVGTPPDLVLRWNAMEAPSRVDVVVHLHGFSKRGRGMRLPRDMVPVSGLDLADPAQPAVPGRRTPTLTVLPRGNFFGGRSGRGYNHPALHQRGALGALVDHALAAFAGHTGVRVPRGRLIVTAHSGGGASLMRVLAYADPDEVHTFDALYTDPSALIAWARSRIARNDGGALRVLFRDHEPTAANSRRVHDAVRHALAEQPGSPAARFRVEATPVPHMGIPPTYGWRLLADAGAELPQARSLAPSGPSPSREFLDEWGEAARAAGGAAGTAAMTAASGSRPLTTTAQVRASWSPFHCAERRMVWVRLLSHRTPVNPVAEPAFRALADALTATGYRARSTWVYNCRSIRAARPGQRPGASLHAYGLAVDIDPGVNPHRRGVRGRIQFSSAPDQAGRERDVAAGRAGTAFTPEQIAAVEAIRTVDGVPVFGWGGRWRSSHDAMHFEIRVTPQQLARGLAVAGPASVPVAAMSGETCEAWDTAEAEEAYDVGEAYDAGETYFAEAYEPGQFLDPGQGESLDIYTGIAGGSGEMP